MIELVPGTVLGERYRIVRPLSAGGMGAVYVVEHITTKKERALKVMRPELLDDAKLRERFAQEAQIGARIESEHVVEVIDAGVDAERSMPWLAMELLIGETLGHLAHRQGALGAGFVRDVLEQLSHAVAAAHDEGVVHRDLKPDNVFLAGRKGVGAPFTVKVLDFGIAKLVSEAHTRFTAALGTPLYMSPEQMSPGSAIGAPTDVWAVGLIAFQLLSGKVYWRAAHAQESTAMMLVNEVTSLVLDAASVRADALGARALPEGFDAWFARAVARDPGDRWGHAREAWNALGPILAKAPRGLYPEIVSPAPRARKAEPAADLGTGEWLAQKNASGIGEAATEIPSLSVPSAFARSEADMSLERADEASPARDLDSKGTPSGHSSARVVGVLGESGAALGATVPAPTDARPIRKSKRTPIALAGLAMLAVAGTGIVFAVRARHSDTVSASAAPSTSGSAAPSPLAQVASIACQDAKLEGSGITPEVAKSLGVGACARLAVAVGVDWRDPKGTPLEVTGSIGDDGVADITLSIAGKSAHAQRNRPLAAISAGASDLAAQIDSPEPNAETIAAWGAHDGIGARRIRRAWRMAHFGFGESSLDEEKALVAAFPDSAWAHWLLADDLQPLSPERDQEIARALDLAISLPTARSHALRGVVLYNRSAADTDEAMGLLRKAYKESPGDLDIASLYAYLALDTGATDEGLSVTDRLYAASPTFAINALGHATNPDVDHDLARDGKYAAELRDVFPESGTWGLWFRGAVSNGRLDDARASLALDAAIDSTPNTNRVSFHLKSAYLDLVEHRPADARDEVKSLLTDPNEGAATRATEDYAQAFYLEGRVLDAEAVLLHEMDRESADSRRVSRSAPRPRHDRTSPLARSAAAG